MRDVLPPKALRQSRVGSRLMRTFELFGYGRVWLPLFEYARVLERAEVHAGGALRFVEPASGDVVALRSDMTPQVARVVSTRYRHAPRPIRLCYQGSVLRRRRERARTESQVIQAGVELVGQGGVEADLEVIELLVDAVSRAGLKDFVLDIGHAAITSSLLDPLVAAEREALVDALSTKDSVELERRARRSALEPRQAKALVALAELHGGQEIWPEAERVLRGTAAAEPAARLRELYLRLGEQPWAQRVVVDLGEVRGFDYYTGPVFQLLALGPGEPIASGGRYDRLYERFGMHGMCAAGFAVDVNNLCWALEHAGVADPSYPRVVAAAQVPRALVSRLRQRDVACCVAEGDAVEYAEAHGASFILTIDPALRISEVGSAGRSEAVVTAATDEQADQVAAFVRRPG